jgi:hypothetical protein
MNTEQKESPAQFACTINNALEKYQKENEKENEKEN